LAGRTNATVPYDYLSRRRRISAIKNATRGGYIGDCDYVLGLEDDTIIPPTALQRLLQAYAVYWGLLCEHRTMDGEPIILGSTRPKSVSLKRDGITWQQIVA
jgi:hypothetical protein